MKITGRTDVGRVRMENQDAYRAGMTPDGIAWGIVCDGMGGMSGGKEASLLAISAIEEVFLEMLEESGAQPDYKQIMLEAIDQANQEVYYEAAQLGKMMGTTVIFSVIVGEKLHLAFAGDSRAYLYTNGHFGQITRDHSVVQDMVDSGILTPQEARVHPDKNVITRALGVGYSVNADYLEVRAVKDSMLLICTDGLTNMLEDEEIQEQIETVDFFELPNRLIELALAAGGADNVTVLLLKIQEDEEDAG